MINNETHYDYKNKFDFSGEFYSYTEDKPISYDKEKLYKLNMYFKSLNNSYSHNKYYMHNGAKIDKEMDPQKEHSSEDKKRYFYNSIKQITNNFVNRNFDNIVVLLGAGASVVNNNNGEIDSNYGKTMNMMKLEVNKRLNAESDKDDSILSLEYISKELKIINSKDNFDLEKIDLENLISKIIIYINLFGQEENVKLKKSLDIIYGVIKNNTSYDFNNNKFNHDKLIKRLSNRINSNNKVTFVTTNYDTLIEDAANSLDFTIFDGFTFSYNPHFDEDMFNWNMVQDVPNIKTNEKIYKENVINLLKIHGSLTWKKDGEKITRVRKNDNLENNDDQPVMIFPSSNKYMQSYQEPYFELFTKFQNALKSPNTLFISSGFSFSDEHISRMIYEAIIHNPSLSTLITNHSIEKNSYTEIFYNLIENEYDIAFLKASLNGFENSLSDYIGG